MRTVNVLTGDSLEFFRVDEDDTVHVQMAGIFIDCYPDS